MSYTNLGAEDAVDDFRELVKHEGLAVLRDTPGRYFSHVTVERCDVFLFLHRSNDNAQT